MNTPYVLHAGPRSSNQQLQGSSSPIALTDMGEEDVTLVQILIARLISLTNRPQAANFDTPVYDRLQDEHDTSYQGGHLRQAGLDSDETLNNVVGDSDCESLMPDREKDAPFIPTEWEFLPLALRDRHPDYDKHDSCPNKRHKCEQWSGYRDEVGYWVCFNYFIGSLFGAIHILAWNFHFPTKWELWAWRLGTCICAGTPGFFFLARWVRNPRFQKGGWKTEYGWELVTERQPLATDIRMMFWICGIFRFYIVVSMFTSFRLEPVRLYETLSWVKYIPHL